MAAIYLNLPTSNAMTLQILRGNFFYIKYRKSFANIGNGKPANVIIFILVNQVIFTLYVE